MCTFFLKSCQTLARTSAPIRLLPSSFPVSGARQNRRTEMHEIVRRVAVIIFEHGGLDVCS